MKKQLCILLLISLAFPISGIAQERSTDTIPEVPALPAFKNTYIIENATNEMLPKEGMEFQIRHRFGLVDSGQDDWFGIFAPSNIRLGLAYGVHKNISLGIGATRFDRLVDVNWKVALFRQTRSDNTPFSMTYNGNFTIDTQRGGYEFAQDRFSYFHQLNIVRRFGPKFSMQLAPSISHYNLVENGRNNILFAVAIGGRFGLTPKTSLLIDYSQPFYSGTEVDLYKAGLAAGVEFATLGHAFQLFFTNYQALSPQKNHVHNTNDFFQGDILLGFNITRIYRFKPRNQ